MATTTHRHPHHHYCAEQWVVQAHVLVRLAVRGLLCAWTSFLPFAQTFAHSSSCPNTTRLSHTHTQPARPAQPPPPPTSTRAASLLNNGHDEKTRGVPVPGYQHLPCGLLPPPPVPGRSPYSRARRCRQQRPCRVDRPHGPRHAV